MRKHFPSFSSGETSGLCFKLPHLKGRMRFPLLTCVGSIHQEQNTLPAQRYHIIKNTWTESPGCYFMVWQGQPENCSDRQVKNLSFSPPNKNASSPKFGRSKSHWKATISRPAHACCCSCLPGSFRSLLLCNSCRTKCGDSERISGHPIEKESQPVLQIVKRAIVLKSDERQVTQDATMAAILTYFRWWSNNTRRPCESNGPMTHVVPVKYQSGGNLGSSFRKKYHLSAAFVNKQKESVLPNRKIYTRCQ